MADRYLELLHGELRVRKSVVVVLKERLLHEECLIKDIEKQILEYANSDKDNGMIIKEHTE